MQTFTLLLLAAVTMPALASPDPAAQAQAVISTSKAATGGQA